MATLLVLASPTWLRGAFKMDPGDLISGKYRLMHLLGTGGMGSVWAARNQFTDRDFAVKFLLPSLSKNKEALQRFFLEARVCGQIRHPALVDVYDMGQAEDGSPYLVRELLRGEGLDQRLARTGPLRAAEAAGWMAFIARGLAEAHASGLVHRDLKPGNIFFSIDDRGEMIPKLLDFGISKANNVDFVKTSPGAVLGSPAYMSPEQAMGEADVDARSDVWSLGVILYEAVTGKTPFEGANYNALIAAIMSQRHIPAHEVDPGIPAEMSNLIEQTLIKDRQLRIATAKEVAERLEAIVGKLTGTQFPRLVPRGPVASIPPPVGITTEGTWSRGKLSGMRGRNPTLWVLAAALSCVAIATAVAFVTWKRPPIVAVGSRSSIAMSTSLARLRKQIDTIRAEEAASAAARAREESGPEAAKSVTSDPSTKVKEKQKDAAKEGLPEKKKPAKDPHGGVDSAGF